MNSQELAKRYFEQFNYLAKKKVDAQTFRDAIAATGSIADFPPDFIGFVLAQAESYGIDSQKELTELAGAQESAKKATEKRRRDEEIKAGFAAMVETLTKYADDTASPEDRIAALSSVSETASKLIRGSAAERPRILFGNVYLDECQAYDPSKEFAPSLCAGLRFPNGTLSYIGARPGIGKSALLINLARSALSAGRKVFLVNLEMLNKTIGTNFILSCMYADADAKQRSELSRIKDPMREYYGLFKREYDERETFAYLRKKVLDEKIPLFGKTFFVYDGTGTSVSLETILNAVETQIGAGDVVLIDYIQRMPSYRDSYAREQQYVKIKQISNALLSAAISRNAVIISGAQFGRSAKDNKGKEATLEDFRESGDIEQDAHNALALEALGDAEDGERYIHILKAREGGADFSRGELECNFKYLYIAGTGKAHKEEAKADPKPKARKPRFIPGQMGYTIEE